MRNLYSSETEIIVDAIDRLTDSFNEKATELIVILKKLDKTYEYPYPEDKVWSNGSGVEGEQESKSMFKHPDCFGEGTDES